MTGQWCSVKGASMTRPQGTETSRQKGSPRGGFPNKNLQKERNNMADFTTSNTTKSAVRKLAAPLADVTAFDNLVQGVVTNNPFQCVGYNSGGVDHPPVERSKQGYTARVIYQDSDAKTIALITIRAPTIAAFTNTANQIVSNNAIALALGGTPFRDFGNERFAATLRCHDANGEIYFVNFSREQVTLTSFSDEAIRSRVETWADTIPSLG
jgi:hypothetical protein